MNDQYIDEKLKEIRKGMKLFDTIVHPDFKTGETTLNKKQTEVVQELFKLFEQLGWQIALNSYKELKYGDSKPIRTHKCGTPVKIRSCKEEHGDKTYFGILLGDMALQISHTIDGKGNLTADYSRYNPAILVPELGEIIYGCESFWGEIESEEDMDKLITDETIENLWYIKALKSMAGENSKEEEE